MCCACSTSQRSKGTHVAFLVAPRPQGCSIGDGGARLGRRSAPLSVPTAAHYRRRCLLVWLCGGGTRADDQAATLRWSCRRKCCAARRSGQAPAPAQLAFDRAFDRAAAQYRRHCGSTRRHGVCVNLSVRPPGSPPLTTHTRARDGAAPRVALRRLDGRCPRGRLHPVRVRGAGPLLRLASLAAAAGAPAGAGTRRYPAPPRAGGARAPRARAQVHAWPEDARRAVRLHGGRPGARRAGRRQGARQGGERLQPRRGARARASAASAARPCVAQRRL